jgi:cytochrome c556
MKTWIKSTLAAGLAIAVLGAGVTTTQPAFADGHKKAGKMMHDKMKKMGHKMKGPKVVKQRRHAMRAISKANKAMKAAAKKGNRVGVIRAATRIASLGAGMPRLFPKGTGRGKLSPIVTRSKPAIWQNKKNWVKFVKANRAMIGAALAVASAANKGNKKAGLKGIGKTCGGCHKPFRGKKAKMMKK